MVCDLSAKEFFECDYTLFALCVDTEKQRMTAGKTTTQARMGEHNSSLSKKDNDGGVERHAKIIHCKEKRPRFLGTALILVCVAGCKRTKTAVMKATF